MYRNTTCEASHVVNCHINVLNNLLVELPFQLNLMLEFRKAFSINILNIENHV